MRDRKKRNIIIGSLCSLLVFMGIGYAVLSQTLNISGTANMKGTWDIKITDISEASRTGKADPGTPTISTSGVSASFEANLWMPGDSITYNITVKNNGNIDAALKELVPSVENGVQQVKFSNNAVQGKVLRQFISYFVEPKLQDFYQLTVSVGPFDFPTNQIKIDQIDLNNDSTTKSLDILNTLLLNNLKYKE